MKIYSLVDNVSNGQLVAELGLSLFIKLDNGTNVLFDMGQSDLFAENAERLGLNIADVDIAVISHGHSDHGGGLETFLKLNSKATVYIHRKAFEPHYSLKHEGLKYIGLNPTILSSELTRDRLMLTHNLRIISEDMILFSNVEKTICFSPANRLLYGADKVSNDDFVHEQNLLIRENGCWTLFAGCAHCGMVNIVKKAVEIIAEPPKYVYGGIHLMKNGLDAESENVFIKDLCQQLMDIPDTVYYTMHCTGMDAFMKMKEYMNDRIEYFNTIGDFVTIDNYFRSP